MHEIVNDENIGSICRYLADKDGDLAIIHRSYGTPPVWERRQGFGTLVQIILEQQVSLSSARAAFAKLIGSLGALTPAAICTLNDDELKAIGFSRQKTSYVRGLAEVVLRGDIELAAFENLTDDEIRSELIKVKGIGDWTADIYLLMAMGRPDIMPKNDLALLAAYRDLKEMTEDRKVADLMTAAEKWRPFRSVAARLLWHFYLSEKRKS